MVYVFFSSVFITLFLVLGTLSLYGFRDPLLLALIAFLCFIAACIFGIQIPDCYATTIL